MLLLHRMAVRYRKLPSELAAMAPGDFDFNRAILLLAEQHLDQSLRYGGQRSWQSIMGQLIWET